MDITRPSRLSRPFSGGRLIARVEILSPAGLRNIPAVYFSLENLTN